MASSLHLKNVLASSPSPYVSHNPALAPVSHADSYKLRAHKDNPVAWQEWGPMAIDHAKTHQRMIFLSVGYTACHWCHVMEKESFSSPEVAEVLNNNFIPIKLDRESRPDLDEIYMSFVTATTGHGGWPLNVFLTPDLKPIFGGTYWPGPVSSTTAPSGIDDDKPLNFLDVLNKMVDVWNRERQRCLLSAEDMTQQLQEFALEGSYRSTRPSSPAGSNDAEPIDLDLLDDALAHFVTKYDRDMGGFSIAPKFPMPVNLRFLLRLGASVRNDGRARTHTRFGFPAPIPAILGKKSCTTAATMALHTLLAMSRSGLRDHLGHGFHRYSVTPDWNLPHFEKMLYDNAELLAVYCDAWALSQNPEILGTIYDLVEYFTSMESPIVRRQGGWFSSEDADSYPGLNAQDEKKEGAYYVWTMKEFKQILGDRDASILARHFGARPDGNVPAKYDVHDELLNQNTIFVSVTPSMLAKEFKLKEADIVKIIKSGKSKLEEYRSANRSKPDIDDKVIASWNGLAINALARAAATLSQIDEGRAQKCRDGAIHGLMFIKNEMYNPKTGKLTRIHNPTSAQDDPTRDLAFVDDYAHIIKAAIGVYDLTLDFQYLDFAFKLQETLDQHFLAGTTSGGYLQAAKVDSPTTLPEQILRLKPGTDNTVPSPNGIIVSNLFYLSSYAKTAPQLQNDLALGDRLYAQAKGTIDAFAVEALQHPFLYVTLLAGVVMENLGMHSLMVPPDMSLEEVQRRGLRGFSRTVVRGPDGMRSGEVMICTRDGVCRPLKEGELDAGDEESGGAGSTA
ncbi:hypothetical protein LTR05_002155 [Lithohypha guttulata]|uniref:Spermatogenesis-associated protein 20-like TRX domain-containing protein n=1 Tax=Lithohypha guttulata TaxID=1690604 RepID=A0AAN7T307_9EURO|nr:hypothetical protein LTR05_002155 [Lithohypha guttulata]